MIPILYESDEMEFRSNGLGRLRDCIRCECVEERNSIYEVEFDYPVTGVHYSDIKLGRIIAVEHDDSGNVQPFDIYKYSRPINGIVTFYASHISYRLNGVIVSKPYVGNVTSLEYALAWIRSDNYPSNPFKLYSDFDASGVLTLADSLPHTVREYLGGTEGSILDIYGGEYEWDRFTVKLLKDRGLYRDITIRYGTNMTEFTDDMDYSETYTAVQTFWYKDGVVVYGQPSTLDINYFNGREYCIPLDLTDEYEEQPTPELLEFDGRQYLLKNRPYLPSQNIKVDFVRLKDMADSKEIANLQKCQLCDHIKVYFPMYDFEGDFKIVRVVWDVLQERYTEMELGNLSTTLSEALGIK